MTITGKSRFFILLALKICIVFHLAGVSHAQQNTTTPQQHSELIASLAAKAIFELDRQQIETIVSNYIENIPEIQGVEVIENLEDEMLASVHRDRQGQLVFSETLPDKVKGFFVADANVLFRGQSLGTIKLYFTKRSEIGLSAEEQNWIKDNPVITIGVEDWYPFIRGNARGEVEGIAADFLEIVLEKTGLEGEFIFDQWSVLLNDFRAGKIDLLPATILTQARKNFGLYSPQYFSGREFIYVKSNNLDIRSLNDLRGKKVAIPKDFGTIALLQEKFPDIDIVETDDQRDSLNRVINGEVEATLEQQIVMDQIIREELLSGIRAIAQSDFETTSIHYFSQKDQPLLNGILTKALNSISDAERLEIISKWLHDGEKNTGPEVDAETEAKAQTYSVLIITLLICVLLFGALFLVIMLLSKRESTIDLSELFGSKKFRLFVLLFLSLLVAIVTVMNWVAITQKKEKSANKVNRELQIVLNISIDRIGAWVADRRAALDKLGRDQELHAMVKDLINSETLKDPIQKEALKSQAKNLLASKLPSGLDEYYVVSSRDTLLVAHEALDGLAHHTLSGLHPDIFEKTFNGDIGFIPPLSQENLKRSPAAQNLLKPGNMFFTVPIRQSDGTVIALLVKRVHAEGALSAHLRLSRVGASGETYAVNLDGKMLTESRFKEDLLRLGFQKNVHNDLIDIDVRDPGGDLTQGYLRRGPLKDRPMTVMMADVLRLKEAGLGYKLSAIQSLENFVHPGNVEGYPDYRGVQVVGAWTWLDDLGFGLTSELDHAEAYEDYFTFRQNLILISAVALILAIGTTLFTLILGQRAHKALRAARDQLEERVEERTRDLQESETRSRSIIENAADAIVVINQKGLVQTFSPAAEMIFGYPAHEVIGQNVAMLMAASIEKDHDHYLARYRERGEKNIIGTSRETTGQRKNGEEFPIDLAVAEMTVGAEKLYTGIIRDISERKEAEVRLKDAYDVISGSIAYASHIQKSVLPDMTPLSSVLHDHFVIWEPRDVVGGDIYWCDFWGDGIHMTLADCTGHGVPGAFVTLLATGAFSEAKNDVFAGDLQAVITRFHKNLQYTLGQHLQSGSTNDGLELGSCFIDPEMTKMFFVGARFDLFIVEQDHVEMIKGTKKGLGYRNVPADQHFASHEIMLKPGLRFYMTSDGLIDQVGGAKKRGFGKKRFSNLLLDIQHLPMADQKTAILEELERYQGTEKRRDDVSLIGFEVSATNENVQSYNI